MKPDIEDRVMELNPDGTPRRVLGNGSTVHDGMLVVRVRSWFIGPDGLTEPERKIKALRDELWADRETYREST